MYSFQFAGETKNDGYGLVFTTLFKFLMVT